MRLFALAAALVLVSCAGGADVSGDRRVVDDVNLSFVVEPARVEVGRSVRLTLRVSNTSGRTRHLDFSSGQLYDFWITDGSAEVWRWSDDRAFSQALERRSVASQDSISFTESWTSEGQGNLIAHGILLAEGFERELTGRVTVGG